jgi:hypothetical protein
LLKKACQRRRDARGQEILFSATRLPASIEPVEKPGCRPVVDGLKPAQKPQNRGRHWGQKDDQKLLTPEGFQQPQVFSETKKALAVGRLSSDVGIYLMRKRHNEEQKKGHCID